MTGDDQPVHGTCVAINGHGVLICGVSGAGKTVLALELVRRARRGGHDAGLVADDRTLLDLQDGALVASCPPVLSGLVEVRGHGIADATAILSGPVPLALVAELVPLPQAVRLRDNATVTLRGIALPLLKLPEGPSPGAANAVLTSLGLPLDL